MIVYWINNDGIMLAADLPEDHAVLPVVAIGALEFESAGSPISMIDWQEGWFRTEADPERKPIPPLIKRASGDQVEVIGRHQVVARYVGVPIEVS